jgi:hypothetical protein
VTNVATPPLGVKLGDGTLSVPGTHGHVRLSESRTRWWNGRIWERTAESTPWTAHFDPTGQKWWDGVAWQPTRRVLPWLRRPMQLTVLQCVAPLLVLVVLLVVGAPGLVALLMMVVAHCALYFSFVATSKVLAGRVRTALFFGVIGMAVLGVIALWHRFTGGGATEVRAAAPVQA